MARVTLTLEDQADGTLKLSLESEPILAAPYTDAQLHMIMTREWLMQSGAKITASEPSLLLDHYEVPPISAD